VVEQVECYSGGIYAEQPRAFLWQDQRQEVEQVLDRRRTPDGRSFRVRTHEGMVFELLYDESLDSWQIRQA
jgi:hypothetical protein